LARIDRFIQAIQMFRGDRLLLASEERVSVGVGAERKPVTAQPATLLQLEELLKEIAPAEAAVAISKGGRSEFTYASPAGAVRVVISRSNGSLRAEATLQGAPAPVTGATAAREAATSPQPAVPSIPQAPAGSAGPVAGESTPSAGGSAAGRMQTLLRKMVAEKCSDLHLSAGNTPIFRKDGEMTPLGENGVLSPGELKEILYSITPPMNREEFEKVHDSDFSYEIPGVARFRSNLFMDRMGPCGVFRVIPSKIPTAEELGLPKHVLELCSLNKGLVLVTGPTGSGKSTTLAAMIDWINRNRTAHILTIEDPIEFVHQNRKCLLNQREVRAHTRDFKSALRAALREDPDIVLVGEMRDLETVAIALETAETGHLVFGTLHTNTAPSTVDRIIDQFPADRQAQVRTILSESLKGVITQMLCRRIGGGRAAAMEVLLVNSAISNLIREGKVFQILSIMQTAKGSGMTTMNDALLDLVTRKIVEPAEAYAKSIMRAELKSQLQRAGFSVEG
jgi:twitching motility protein PilT